MKCSPTTAPTSKCRNRPGGSDDTQIDTTTGTVKVREQFDNADNALFPNQFVNAQLLVKTLHNVVTVPTAAIQRGAPGSYVYVINADNRVSVRPVNIGSTEGPMAAVNSGVSLGERGLWSTAQTACATARA